MLQVSSFPTSPVNLSNQTEVYSWVWIRRKKLLKLIMRCWRNHGLKRQRYQGIHNSGFKAVERNVCSISCNSGNKELWSLPKDWRRDNIYPSEGKMWFHCFSVVIYRTTIDGKIRKTSILIDRSCCDSCNPHLQWSAWGGKKNHHPSLWSWSLTEHFKEEQRQKIS